MERCLDTLTTMRSSLDTQLALAFGAKTDQENTDALRVKLFTQLGEKVTYCLATLQRIQHPM